MICATCGAIESSPAGRTALPSPRDRWCPPLTAASCETAPSIPMRSLRELYERAKQGQESQSKETARRHIPSPAQNIALADPNLHANSCMQAVPRQRPTDCHAASSPAGTSLDGKQGHRATTESKDPELTSAKMLRPFGCPKRCLGSRNMSIPRDRHSIRLCPLLAVPSTSMQRPTSLEGRCCTHL